jgi:hypothetical protein
MSNIKGPGSRIFKARSASGRSLSKKVLDIDRRFIDATSAALCDLCVKDSLLTQRAAEERRDRREPQRNAEIAEKKS